MAIHGVVNTCPIKDKPDKLSVILVIKTNLIGLQQYLLSSVRVCDKFKRLETCDASAGLCSEVHMVPKKPSSALHGSGRCSSQQGHTGCLQVTLEVLQGFCIEAGAHHRGNPSWTGSRQSVKCLCQMHPRVVHRLTHRVILLFTSKRQLWEGSLVPWCVFYVNEVLFVRDAVIFR